MYRINMPNKNSLKLTPKSDVREVIQRKNYGVSKSRSNSDTIPNPKTKGSTKKRGGKRQKTRKSRPK
jgi:hypothetical protein